MPSTEESEGLSHDAMQLQPLINRIKEIGGNYGRTPTQVLFFYLYLSVYPSELDFTMSVTVRSVSSSGSRNVVLVSDTDRVAVCAVWRRSGGAQLAGVPGQRGADPGGEERGAGAGVRGRAGVEPDGRRGGGAALHGAPGQARHRLPGGEAVTTRSLPAGS